MELKEVVEEIKKENIVLIYAFNGTGKTRLSVEYKNMTKEVQVYITMLSVKTCFSGIMMKTIIMPQYG